MKTQTPVLFTKIGGVLIFLSGIISLVVALTFGAVLYEVDPNGLFGHVGILAGLAAMLIGGFLFWLSSREHKTRRQLVVAGLLTIVFGHIGAVAGAMLVGTAGVFICYVAGIWFFVLATRYKRQSF